MEDEAVDALVVATMRRWVADEFRAAAVRRGLRVIHSWGLDIPDLTGIGAPAWWTPTEHAARLMRSGVLLPLLAPGPGWLSTLPAELTGRLVWSGTLSRIDEAPRSGWAKPAEMKVEQLPAAWWGNIDEFAAAARAAGLPADSWVQVSPVDLDIVAEFRCFVADRQVVAASPYLVADGTTYHEGMEREMARETALAAEFASVAVAAVGDGQPPAYVLDVALLGGDRWVVLEGNPAWSSATYGADLDGALRTVLAAADHACAYPQWRWSPDPFLVGRAERAQPLPRG